ncbi:peptidase inhibitor family I36 protein [Salmonella enterica subsp. diarizonae]
MSEQDVYLIKNESGADKCPSGKLALYTNVDFNGGEMGDILIISPNVALTKQDLEGYGFIVGEHDGVSSVVNNMDQDATLVSGLYLDGATLTVSPGLRISSPIDFPLATGNWNDEVNSVVSAGTRNVDLSMSIESEIVLEEGEEYSALLQIHNNTSEAVEGVTVSASSSNSAVFSAEFYSQTLNIPGNETVNVRIPVEGKGQGKATLTCQLTMPLGIINSGNNMTQTTVTVSETRALQVTQSFAGDWADTWPSTNYIYSYKLILSSADTEVDKWELSFLLPEGAEVSPEWLETESSWVQLNTEKSVNGNVYLDSEPGHVIAPEKDIELDIQIIYPNQSTDYQTLKNLRLMQKG